MQDFRAEAATSSPVGGASVWFSLSVILRRKWCINKDFASRGIPCQAGRVTTENWCLGLSWICRTREVSLCLNKPLQFQMLLKAGNILWQNTRSKPERPFHPDKPTFPTHIPNVPNPERLLGDYKLREDRVTSLAGSITVVVPKTWWGVETISNTVLTVPSHESWVNCGEAPRKRPFGSQKVAFRYEFLPKHGHFRVPCWILGVTFCKCPSWEWVLHYCFSEDLLHQSGNIRLVERFLCIQIKNGCTNMGC